jgi:hypothetical protein
LYLVLCRFVDQIRTRWTRCEIRSEYGKSLKFEHLTEPISTESKRIERNILTRSFRLYSSGKTPLFVRRRRYLGITATTLIASPPYRTLLNPLQRPRRQSESPSGPVFVDLDSRWKPLDVVARHNIKRNRFLHCKNSAAHTRHSDIQIWGSYVHKVVFPVLGVGDGHLQVRSLQVQSERGGDPSEAGSRAIGRDRHEDVFGIQLEDRVLSSGECMTIAMRGR